MSNPLLDNIRKMRNDELIGLAKNRFLPEEMQLALIDIGYRTGHMHLMENAGLTKKARDLLWSDSINSGYVYKITLIHNGYYKDDTDKYWELFDKYPSAWSRSPWRMMNAFLYHRDPASAPGGWYSRQGLECGANHTPADLLNKIYDTYFSKKIEDDYRSAFGIGYAARHRQHSFASHPNCDLELAIKVSTCGDPQAQKKAFEKIVELS